MKKIATIIFILLTISSVVFLNAAPADKSLRVEILPDGSSIEYYVKGDEKVHYTISPDGYVMMKASSGFYYYAQKDSNGYLVSSNTLAHNQAERTQDEITFLQSISPFLTYDSTQIDAFLLPFEQNVGVTKIGNKKVLSAELPTLPIQPTRNLVILVNFSDKSFVVSNPNTEFLNLLNQENYSNNGATGSARDYFNQSSFGNYIPDFDVVGPYTLPNNTAYYGADSGGDDIRPQQMFIDACQLADNDGLDFSLYDTNNDGDVDNVFIIYAGNNQAEAGTSSLVWPHSWFLDNKNTMFDGKSIYLYSCTSELRGSGTAASNISGIGTFCHEFSHLLGLPDLYHTTTNTVFCLDEWDIMDGGLYSNLGKTPAAYSAYERFYLGWLTPEILNQTGTKTLDNLIDSNKAYIIAASTPDLNGFNPTPKEFFLIENRQKQGFDAYLPYHGMLVWHIDYDQTAWSDNIPNNSVTNTSASHQRVYIVPADGVHTLSTKTADPFPGASNITTYSPILWDGTDLNKPFINISETNGIISFNFMPQFEPNTPVTATDATGVYDKGFVANWIYPFLAESYCLILYKDTTIESPYDVKINEPFSNLTALIDDQITDFESNGLIGWTGQYVYHGASTEPSTSETTNALRIGSSLVEGDLTTPSINLSANNGVATVEFDLRIWNSTNEKTNILVQYAPNGVDFTTISTISGSKTIFEQKTLQISGGTNIGKIRFTGNGITNRFFIDNINIYQGEKTGSYIQSDSINKYCGILTNSFQLTGLDSNQDYSYVIIATDGVDFTPYSNKISVKTRSVGTDSLDAQNVNVWSKNGVVYISGIVDKTALDIYQTDGKLILKRDSLNAYTEIPLNQKGIFILKLVSEKKTSFIKLLAN